MKVEYTNRAVADLQKAAADSRAGFGERVAAALERRIREVIAHIAEHPDAAPRVVQRSGMRGCGYCTSDTPLAGRGLANADWQISLIAAA